MGLAVSLFSGSFAALRSLAVWDVEGRSSWGLLCVLRVLAMLGILVA